MLLSLLLPVLAAGSGCAPPPPPPLATATPPPPPPAPVPPPPPPRESLVILLADPDGAVGRIVVSTPAGEREVSEAGRAVRVTSPDAPPGEPAAMTAGEVEAVFGGALRALPPAPTHFILYFQKDSTRLTPESQALLPLVMAAVRERAPADVSVVGHTDTAGEGRRNYELGLKRAQTVAEMLSLEDLTPAGLQVTSHGEENPLVPTPDDVAEPRNRRVEVIVR